MIILYYILNDIHYILIILDAQSPKMMYQIDINQQTNLCAVACRNTDELGIYCWGGKIGVQYWNIGTRI